MNIKKIIPAILRLLSIFIILLILFFLFANFYNKVFKPNKIEDYALYGYTDISGINFNESKPVMLNGQWDYYEDVYLEEYDKSLLINPKLVKFPLNKIAQNTGNATYKLVIKNSYRGKMSLYLPNITEKINIFVNGVKQNNNTQTIDDFLLNVKIFDISFDMELPQQELVISVTTDNKENPMYKRPVLIGSHEAIFYYSYFSMSNSIFVFALFIIIVLSSYIFLFLYPKHIIISLITLLDSMIAFRLFFGMDYVFDYIYSIFGTIYLSHSFKMSMQIFFLMMAGVVGSLLSHYLFDEENKIPRFLTLPMPWLYAVLAVVFSVRLDLFDKYGVAAMIVVFIYTFVIAVSQSHVYWKKLRSPYALIQSFKTYYIGLVIAIDILFMGKNSNIMMFTCAYMLFLLAHLIIRIYDNKTSYVQVAELNQDLEKKVEERTAELIQANKVLSEISIRDALTNAYNRLFFERVIENEIMHFEPETDSLYLCIFDLDNFKRINDNYGHAAGDEQLIFVVESVNKIIDKQTLLARVGGEEFILLFKNISNDEVKDTIEKIRLVLEENSKQDEKRTTGSFGVAKYKIGLSQRDFFKMADKYLYHSKNTGKNKISYSNMFK